MDLEFYSEIITAGNRWFAAIAADQYALNDSNSIELYCYIWADVHELPLRQQALFVGQNCLRTGALPDSFVAPLPTPYLGHYTGATPAILILPNGSRFT